ncbi:MAG: hypothetical protein LBQ34_05795 [Alphaproteobacteria bacterium]|jgi:hypothetical protein|nr:hypothetical protein [Alphaproteobacteria bacterium]
MQKIIFIAIFSIFSFSLMAEVIYTPAEKLTPRKQTEKQYYIPDIKQNSLSISAGGASGQMAISSGDTRSYDSSTELRAKNNFNLSYLRRVSGGLSIGLDLTMFTSNDAKYTKYADSAARDGRNRTYVDSSTCQYINGYVASGACDEDTGKVADGKYCSSNPANCNGGKIDCSVFNSYCNSGRPDPNFDSSTGGGSSGSGNTGRPILYEKVISSNSYAAMLLANYDIYRGKDVGLAIQTGVGANYRELDIGFTSGGATTTEKQSSTSLAAKAGVVGDYYLSDSFAIGAGIHYVYTSQADFKFNTFGDNKVNSNGIITYNLRLSYLF